MGVMRVLCKQGDIRVEWDANDPESVANAKLEFERLKADGYEFFESPSRKRVKGWSAKRGSVLAVPGVQHKADKPIAPRRSTTRRRGAMAGGPVAGVSRSPLWDTVVAARITR